MQIWEPEEYIEIIVLGAESKMAIITPLICAQLGLLATMVAMGLPVHDGELYRPNVIAADAVLRRVKPSRERMILLRIFYFRPDAKVRNKSCGSSCVRACSNYLFSTYGSRVL